MSVQNNNHYTAAKTTIIKIIYKNCTYVCIGSRDEATQIIGVGIPYFLE